jgi:hypothetical protein
LRALTRRLTIQLDFTYFIVPAPGKKSRPHSRPDDLPGLRQERIAGTLALL